MEPYESLIVFFVGCLTVSIVAGLFFRHDDKKCKCGEEEDDV